jgi:flagellar hook assembly protein FlgD
LERIDPSQNSTDDRNWSSSVALAGGTPGARNSIFIGSIAHTSSLSLSPNPFSPDNDGYQDFLSINYSLPTNSAVIRVRIYDVTGRLVRRLVQSEPAASAGSVIWNGLDDDRHRVRIGMYIILFEAFDNFGGTVKTMKDVAVVARKL